MIDKQTFKSKPNKKFIYSQINSQTFGHGAETITNYEQIEKWITLKGTKPTTMTNILNIFLFWTCCILKGMSFWLFHLILCVCVFCVPSLVYWSEYSWKIIKKLLYYSESLNLSGMIVKLLIWLHFFLKLLVWILKFLVLVL